MSSESICIICCNPIKTLSIGVCEHTEICADCVHRNSALYKQCECSICKKDLSFVIFCAPGERSKFKFPHSKEEAEELIAKEETFFLPEDIIRKKVSIEEAKAANSQMKSKVKELIEQRKQEEMKKKKVVEEGPIGSAPAEPIEAPPVSGKKNKKKKGKAAGSGISALGNKDALARPKTPEVVDLGYKGILCSSVSVAMEYVQKNSPLCKVCSKNFKTIEELKRHLKDVHSLLLCDICLRDRNAYLSEQVLLKPEELIRHNNEWDGGVKETFEETLETKGGHLPSPDVLKPLTKSVAVGHPMCKFCKTRMYNIDTLYAHLNSHHALCPLCNKHGNYMAFYRDMVDLFEHYRISHFKCPVEGCELAFDTKFEVDTHVALEHPQRSGKGGKKSGRNASVQIQGNFVVRRQARDGSGIVERDEYDPGSFLSPEEYYGRDERRERPVPGGRSLTPSAKHSLEYLESIERKEAGGKKSKSPDVGRPPRSESENAHKLRIARPGQQQEQPEQQQERKEKSESPKTPSPEIKRPKEEKKEDFPPLEGDDEDDVAVSKPKASKPTQKRQQPKKNAKSVPQKPKAQETPSAWTRKPEEKKEVKKDEDVSYGIKGGLMDQTRDMSAAEKNSLLVSTMQSLVDESQFRGFMSFSRMYLKNEKSVAELYSRFFVVFGMNDQSRELFLLLASTVPNDEKRIEMLEYYTLQEKERHKPHSSTTTSSFSSEAFPALPPPERNSRGGKGKKKQGGKK